MTPIVATIGTVLLAGSALGLAATDHLRLAVATTAAAVLLLAQALSASFRSPRL